MHFAEAQRLYHVTTNLDAIPESDSIADSALQEYLSSDDSRQLLHITYGWLLQDLEIRGPLLNLLRDNEEAHYAAVANNMAKHIRLLGIKPIMA